MFKHHSFVYMVARYQPFVLLFILTIVLCCSALKNSPILLNIMPRNKNGGDTVTIFVCRFA